MARRVGPAALGIILALAPFASAARDMCTAVLVGRDATVDGSTMTTHNADCLNCDYRLARTKAKDHPEGAEHAVFMYKAEYPRIITEERSPVWSEDNLEDYPQKPEWQTEDWKRQYVRGHIPEVNHTYAILEALFGIMNEKGLAMGESTCTARYFGVPQRACVDCAGPLLDATALSVIALERCATAQCAVKLMGELAEKFGYYACEQVESEGGEALTIADGKEAWMFHILPDPTGTTAIWAAQRLLPDHVSVCANAFVIRAVDPNSPDFLFSTNLFDIAAAEGLWDPHSGKPLDFNDAYGQTKKVGDDEGTSHTRRMWRVLDLAAPSLKLSPYVDWHYRELPFSVKVDKKLHVRDVMAMKRDLYEGTAFDLTQGPPSGPYGNPGRWDGGDFGAKAFPDDYGEYDRDLMKTGHFERAISMFRTSYSFVAVSRADMPPEVGSVLWFSQHSPHAAAYTPLYPNGGDQAVPAAFSIGSLHKYNPGAMFWRFAVVKNWADMWFKFAIRDVRDVQYEVEESLFASQAEVEQIATGLVAAGDVEGAAAALSEFSSAATAETISRWTELFEFLLTKYHDGYSLASQTALTVDMRCLWYPMRWLKEVGFFKPQPPVEGNALEDAPATPVSYGASVASHVAVALVCVAAGFLVGQRATTTAPPATGRKGYSTIVDVSSPSATVTTVHRIQSLQI